MYHPQSGHLAYCRFLEVKESAYPFIERPCYEDAKPTDDEHHSDKLPEVVIFFY